MSEGGISMHKWFGVLCPITALIWLYLSVWDINTKMKGYFLLLLFGFLNLWLYADKRKQGDKE